MEENAMRVDDIRTYHRKQPFRPFVLHLSDGQKIRVAHQELIIYVEGGRTVLVMHPDGNWDAIDILHIVKIDDRAGHNGKSDSKGKRRKSA
jgi:hypothetical protein